jgi:hypothetical protein
MQADFILFSRSLQEPWDQRSDPPCPDVAAYYPALPKIPLPHEECHVFSGGQGKWDISSQSFICSAVSISLTHLCLMTNVAKWLKHSTRDRGVECLIPITDHV